MLGTGRPLEAFEQDRMASVHEAQRKAEQTSESGPDLTLRESLIATTCRVGVEIRHPPHILRLPGRAPLDWWLLFSVRLQRSYVSGVEGEGRWKKEAEAKSGAR